MAEEKNVSKGRLFDEETGDIMECGKTFAADVLVKLAKKMHADAAKGRTHVASSDFLQEMVPEMTLEQADKAYIVFSTIKKVVE